MFGSEDVTLAPDVLLKLLILKLLTVCHDCRHVAALTTATVVDRSTGKVWWVMVHDVTDEEDDAGQPTDNPVCSFRVFEEPVGTSTKALAHGDREKGRCGEPEFTLAAADKTFDHAGNCKDKTHAKKHEGHLDVNPKGRKVFKLVEAEEATRADPTSEGMVAPTMSAEDSRAVTDRRKRRKKDDSAEEADDEDDDEDDDMSGDREGDGESPEGEPVAGPAA